MNGTIRKVVKILAISFCAIYLFYFAAVAVILNTKLFGKLTDMDDPDTTHITFSWAVSPFPGYLYAGHTKVGVRDQNVTIDIFADDASIWFDLLPIFKKRLQTTAVNIHFAKINILMKSVAEKSEFIKNHTTEKSDQLNIRIAEGNENRKTRIKMEFPKIKISKITSAQFPWGELKGDLSLDGGFNIQPGVEVEVFPSLLKIENASVKDQFENINGEALVEFTPFFIPESPGNVVLPHINAEVTLSALAHSMDLLNLTLRSIPGYSFTGDTAKLKAHFKVKNGVVLEDSMFESSRSRLGIHSEEIDADGTGNAIWKMHKKYSELDVKLENVKVNQKGANLNAGKAKTINFNARLFGTELIHLFEGLCLNLNLKEMVWQFKDQDEEISGIAKGGGTLLGFSGTIPEAAKTAFKKQKTSLLFDLNPVKIKSESIPGLSLVGKLNVVAKPILFADNRIEFDQAAANVKILIPNQKESNATIQLSELSYSLHPNQQWKGKLNVKLDDTGPFIDALKSKDKISGLIATFANVSDLNVDADLEVGPLFTWIRINKVNSSGIWSAYGSIIDPKSTQDKGFRGILEVKFAGLPVGIKITPEETNVKFLPGEDWYNEFLNGNSAFRSRLR